MARHLLPIRVAALRQEDVAASEKGSQLRARSSITREADETVLGLESDPQRFWSVEGFYGGNSKTQ